MRTQNVWGQCHQFFSQFLFALSRKLSSAFFAHTQKEEEEKTLITASVLLPFSRLDSDSLTHSFIHNFFFFQLIIVINIYN